MKSLALRDVFVGDDGFPDLSCLKESPALDELTLDLAPLSALESLLSLKCLRLLHLSRQGWINDSQWALLELDHGDRIHVPRNKLDRYVDRVQALRECFPGIIIDAGDDPFHRHWVLDTEPPNDDPFTDWLHQSDIWLSNPELPWLMPAGEVYPY